MDHLRLLLTPVDGWCRQAKCYDDVCSFSLSLCVPVLIPTSNQIQGTFYMTLEVFSTKTPQTYGYITMSQAMQFTADFKLGQ